MDPHTSRGGMSSGARIGLGVGLTLGVLLLLAAMFFLFLRARRRRWDWKANKQYSAPSELETRTVQRAEADGEPLYILPTRRRSELPARAIQVELDGGGR
jgi:hypothetical protein